VEAFFMLNWRHALGPDARSFYTRGRTLANLYGPDGRWPTWQECHRNYVQNIYTEQIGYTLRNLGLVVSKKLTGGGRNLAAALLASGNLRAKLTKWLDKGTPPPRKFGARFQLKGTLSPRKTSDAERNLIEDALFANHKDGRQRHALWKRLRNWKREDTVRSRALFTLAQDGSNMSPPLNELLPHVAAYERLRQQATLVTLPRIMMDAPDGSTAPIREAVQELKHLAAEVPDLKREHHQAKALRTACLEPTALKALCNLTGGLCRLDGSRIKVFDHARARHIAEAGVVEEDNSNSGEALEEISYRSYQLWNLWQLGKHLSAED